jgi:hypothetical protein
MNHHNYMAKSLPSWHYRFPPTFIFLHSTHNHPTFISFILNCFYLMPFRLFTFGPGIGYNSLHQMVAMLSSSRDPFQVNTYHGERRLYRGPESVGAKEKQLDQNHYEKCYHWWVVLLGNNQEEACLINICWDLLSAKHQDAEITAGSCYTEETVVSAL